MIGQSRHNPGPWQADYRDDYDDPRWDVYCAGKLNTQAIAVVFEPNAEDNARLIAKAPAMYAAIRKAIDFLENTMPITAESIVYELLDAVEEGRMPDGHHST